MTGSASPVIQVFGAVNVDVIVASDRFLTATSASASIEVRLGGVGYNLFAALPTPDKRLVSVVGDDWFLPFVLQRLPLEKCQLRRLSGANNLYVALMQQGALHHGAVDTRLLDEGFDVAWAEEAMASVASGDTVVVDFNLPVATLERILVLCRAKGCRALGDPVSVPKARRASAVVRDIFLLSPTEEELEGLLGGPASDRAVHHYLRTQGVENLLVTRGPRGVRWYGLSEDCLVQREWPVPHALPLSDSTGAGDFLLASVTYRVARGTPLADALPGALRDTHAYLLQRVPSASGRPADPTDWSGASGSTVCLGGES